MVKSLYGCVFHSVILRSLELKQGLQALSHLVGDLFGFLGSDLCKTLGMVGIDDGATGVDDETALLVHTVLDNFLQRAALCTDTRNKEERVGGDAANVLKHLALGSTYDKHNLILSAPSLDGAEHLLKEACRSAIDGRKLEVMRTLVGGQGKTNDPLALIAEEWLQGVLAHIGSHGDSIKIEVLEERTRIKRRGVANVATLGIGDDELIGILLANVADGLLEGDPSFHAKALVESEVGLVSDAVGLSGIDDGLVELEDGILSRQLLQVLGNLLDVGVETYAKEGLLLLDLFEKLRTSHDSGYFEGFGIIGVFGEDRSNQNIRSIPNNRKSEESSNMLFLDEPGNALDLVVEVPIAVEVREPVLDEDRLADL